MLESLFNKFLDLQAYNFTKKRLQHRVIFTLFYLLSFVFIRFFHSLSFAVTHCHLLLIVVFRCHSLSLVVTCCTAHCRPLSLFVSLVVIRCTTRCHSLYHWLSFIVTRCHSMSLDVPLVCLFINDHYFIIFCFLHHL